jgi:hypothetical protein
VRERLRRLAELPPEVLRYRLRRRAAEAAARPWLRLRDASVATLPAPTDGAGLRPLLDALDARVLEPWRPQVAALAEHAMAHRFDVLGSGWVRVEHGMRCRGLEGHVYPPGPAVRADADGTWLRARVNAANLSAARGVWRLVEGGYQPVDWSLDVRSGHRWPGTRWSGDPLPAAPPGADVKVPWELSRMQHLPQLAWAYLLGRGGGGGMPASDACAREFRNQVLDFTATNPPRYGVNWASAMDVALRGAGWALAWSLFHAAGARFDAPFLGVLESALRAHARFVAAHLEWDPVLRGNHFLADVAGLLVMAAALPEDGETDGWLAFGARALPREVAFQFHGEGTHFEASTGYHRLCAEMVAYASAVLLGVDPGRLARVLRTPAATLGGVPAGALDGDEDGAPFSPSFRARVRGMARFLEDVALPDGRMPQVGDHDSGRFFKPFPAMERRTAAEARDRYAHLAGYDGLSGAAPYWDEDPLDARHLAAAFAGLCGWPAADGGPWAAEAALVRALARGRPLEAEGTDESTPDASVPETLPVPPAPARYHSRAAEIRAPGADLREGLRFFAWRGFGLYCFRSRRLYLGVRCAPPAGTGGAHAHNDQLGLELWVDGEPWLTDPGTYLYTPLPERRNAYRSVRAHFAPAPAGREPAPLGAGLFHLPPVARARCLAFGADGFTGELVSPAGRVRRTVRIHPHAVEVRDEEWTAEGSPPPADGPWVHPEGVPVSPGYGLLYARTWSVNLPAGAWRTLDGVME